MPFYLCCFDLCFFTLSLLYSVFVFELMRVQFAGVTWDFFVSESAFIADFLFLQFLYSPRLHSYASTFVHTLKIPNSVSNAIVRHQTQILVIVQFKIVSMHSEKPICAPPHLSTVCKHTYPQPYSANGLPHTHTPAHPPTQTLTIGEEVELLLQGVGGVVSTEHFGCQPFHQLLEVLVQQSGLHTHSHTSTPLHALHILFFFSFQQS